MSESPQHGSFKQECPWLGSTVIVSEMRTSADGLLLNPQDKDEFSREPADTGSTYILQTIWIYFCLCGWQREIFVFFFSNEAVCGIFYLCIHAYNHQHFVNTSFLCCTLLIDQRLCLCVCTKYSAQRKREQDERVISMSGELRWLWSIILVPSS